MEVPVEYTQEAQVVEHITQAGEEAPEAKALPTFDETPLAEETQVLGDAPDVEAPLTIEEMQKISPAEEVPELPEAETLPITQDTPILEEVLLVEEVLEIQVAPETEVFPIINEAQNTPIVEETSDPEARPTVGETQEISTVEELIEESSFVNQIPIDEEVPVPFIEETPLDRGLEEALVADGAPIAEDLPVVDASAVGDTPVAGEVPEVKEAPVVEKISPIEETLGARELQAVCEVLEPTSGEKTQEIAAVESVSSALEETSLLPGPAAESNSEVEVVEPAAGATIEELPTGDVLRDDKTLTTEGEQVCDVQAVEEIPTVIEASVVEDFTFESKPYIEESSRVGKAPLADTESATREASTLEVAAMEETSAGEQVLGTEEIMAASETVSAADELKQSEFVEESVSSSDLKEAVVSEPLFESLATGEVEASGVYSPTEEAAIYTGETEETGISTTTKELIIPIEMENKEDELSEAPKVNPT